MDPWSGRLPGERRGGSGTGRPRGEFTTASRGRTAEVGFASFESADAEDTEIPYTEAAAEPLSRNVLFQDALAAYLENRLERGHQSKSYHYLRRFWRSEFEGRPMAEIGPEQIAAAVRRWQFERGWRAATQANCLAQLSGFLTYSIRRNWTCTHPILDSGLEMVLPPDRGPAQVENESDREQVWDE